MQACLTCASPNSEHTLNSGTDLKVRPSRVIPFQNSKWVSPRASVHIGNLQCLDHAIGFDCFADIVPFPTLDGWKWVLVAGFESLSDGAAKHYVHHQEILEVGFEWLDFGFHGCGCCGIDIESLLDVQ